jgi:hypothetical protein
MEQKILKEVSRVLQKYNCKNCIVAGNFDDEEGTEHFFGYFSVEEATRKDGKASVKSAMLSFMNVGRLYQSAREHILRRML